MGEGCACVAVARCRACRPRASCVCPRVPSARECRPYAHAVRRCSLCTLHVRACSLAGVTTDRCACGAVEHVRVSHLCARDAYACENVCGMSVRGAGSCTRCCARYCAVCAKLRGILHAKLRRIFCARLQEQPPALPVLSCWFQQQRHIVYTNRKSCVVANTNPKVLTNLRGS